MSKIIEGLKQAVVVARCKPHRFQYLKDHGDEGVAGICTQCDGRFTAWPGTIYYDEIIAAKPSRGG